MRILFTVFLFAFPSLSLSQWQTTGSLSHVRYYHSAVKLGDGRVLVTGGQATGDYDARQDSSCEIYNPRTGTWLESAPMHYARSGHSSILLSDGRVLVIDGGPARCELYDPKRNSWDIADSLFTTPLSMQHQALLCTDGNIVVVSYQPNPMPIQIYDPQRGKWTLAYYPLPIRYAFRMTRFKGNALVTGGLWTGVDTCSIIDPSTGIWINTSLMNEGHANHTATTLSSGKVLVTGGEDYRGTSLHPKSSCEMLDPDTMVWRYVAPLNLPRIGHTATLLFDGRVLVVGGLYDMGSPPRIETEIYNPETDHWSMSGDLQFARSGYSITLLDDSTVLVAGGCDTTACELFHPDLVTRIGSHDGNEPAQFRLDQNFPDPFNPSTTIRYAIPKSEFVVLKVYDELGREVATLVKGGQSQGEYSITFNGANLGSGVYFYRLQAGAFNQTKKMMFIK